MSGFQGQRRETPPPWKGCRAGSATPLPPLAAAWIGGLALLLRHRLIVSHDTMINYAHVWYVSKRLWGGHGIPFRMPVLGHGQAFAFPYGVVPWLTAAVARPLAGDWIVTLWMVLGIAGLLVGHLRRLPGAAARLVGGHATSQPGAGGGGAHRPDAVHLGGRPAAVGGRRLAPRPSRLGGGAGGAGARSPIPPSSPRWPLGLVALSRLPVRTGRPNGPAVSCAGTGSRSIPMIPAAWLVVALPRLRGELDGREAGQLRHHPGPPLAWCWSSRCALGTCSCRTADAPPSEPGSGRPPSP